MPPTVNQTASCLPSAGAEGAVESPDSLRQPFPTQTICQPLGTWQRDPGHTSGPFSSSPRHLSVSKALPPRRVQTNQLLPQTCRVLACKVMRPPCSPPGMERRPISAQRPPAADGYSAPEMCPAHEGGTGFFVLIY